jgi:alpha-glucosidase (family GH31 glycosyl hydrolase)
MRRRLFWGGTFLCLLVGAAQAQDPFPGNPPIAPRWAFEPIVWEDNTNTRASTEGLVQGYLDRKIPVGGVIIDSPWETFQNNGVFDQTRYPGPQAMIDNFHAKNVKVVLWITGFVDTDDPDHAYVKAQNLGVNSSQDLTWWRGTGIHVDFTKPAAETWWHGVMDKTMNMGIDGWKVDQSADYVPDPVQTSLGQMTRQNFKKYYHAALFDYATSKNPAAMITARAFSTAQGGIGASISKVSMCWQGDFYGDFSASGIPLQVHDVYKSALLGYGNVGVEIGGYYKAVPTKNSLIRYAQFGAMTSFMENGGSNGGLAQHLPWYWDAQTIAIYQYFATLHSELAPYNFSYGVEAHLAGVSALRNADTVQFQHLLGDQLLVSPFTTDATTKAVHFPAGSQWIDYWNDSIVYQGGTSTNYSAPLDKFPIFIKAGAIVPLNVKNAIANHGDSTSSGKITLLVYPKGLSQFTFHRPTSEGIAYEDIGISSDESTGIVKVAGDSTLNWRLRIKSALRPLAVTGGDSWSYDPSRKLVIVDKTGSSFSIAVQNRSTAVASSKSAASGAIRGGTSEGTFELFDLKGHSIRVVVKQGETLNSALRKSYPDVPRGVYCYRALDDGNVPRGAAFILVGN